ncbi:MAG: glycosyltransferase [Candidatus Kapabacteria bacterium]|nr:glycosyltransferase [Candidatus Kapabacteria bacterium]
MQILFLTPRFILQPVIGGDRLKSFHILSHLAKNHKVTLVSFYQGKENTESSVKVLTDLGIDVHIVPLNPIKAGLNSLLKFYRCLPFEIFFYTQPHFAKTVDKLCNEKQFDLGISFFMRTAEYLKDKKFKKILMAEDCRTLYMKRSSNKTGNIPQKIIRSIEHRLLQTYEPKIVSHFDVTTLVTETDINQMRQQNSSARYELISNGTDISLFSPPQPQIKRKGIVFIGKLNLLANEMMVEKIINEIFPLIKKRIPDVELNIVGAEPSSLIKNLVKKYDGIKFHFDVPSTVPFYQNALIFLHPHSGASGIQNKILEAMSSGCVVVTTKSGNQGINGEHLKNILIGTDSNELAELACNVLSDENLAINLSENSRNFIEAKHSWESVYRATDKLLIDLFK